MSGDLFQNAVVHHQRGQLAEAEALYRQLLATEPTNPQCLHYLGVVALQRGQNQAAVDLIKQALDQVEDSAEAHFNIGLAYAALGRMDEVERHNRRAVSLKPDHAEAHANLGNALNALGRTDDAMASLGRAKALRPNQPEVHFNLANVMFGRHELDAAIDGYQRALALRPNYADALQNLATALALRGRLADAVAAFRRVLEFRPDFPPALSGLAMALLALRQEPEAMRWLSRAVDLQPTMPVQQMFCECVSKLTTIPKMPALHDQLIRAITQAWVEPRALAPFVANYLMHQPAVGHTSAEVVRLGKSGATAAHVASLAADPLCIALLEGGPIANLQMEALFTAIRSCLLGMVAAGAEGDASTVAFTCALARQCFLNEYLYDRNEADAAAARALRDQIASAIAANAQPSSFQIAVAATWFPLSDIEGADRLLSLGWPDQVRSLLDLQVRNALTEAKLKAAIPRLTAVEDDVSRKVRQQYEDNPYPRWIKLPVQQPLRFDRWVQTALPLADVRPPADARIDILIAGCGTGLQPIVWSQACEGANILAVDLSLSSLAYGRRRADELGIRNIEFAQADILQLPSTGRSFAFVETTGVLHHMADPFGAWLSLSRMVKPGGLMGIGLYSEIARRGIQRCRNLVAGWECPAGPDGLRQIRRRLSGLAEASAVVRLNDFYATSEFRDLVLHVQEQQMSLPQIAEFLRSTDLQFLGFLVDRSTLARYCARFPEDRTASDLASWHRFEQDNPETFLGMYNFLVQRAG